MTYIIILLLVFFVCLSLIMLGSLWYMKVLLEKMLGSKLRDLETLTVTGSIPEAWTAKYDRQMIRYQERGKIKQVKRIQQTARKVYLNKIGKLAAHVRRTTLVESEEVRSHTLRILQRVEREWRDAVTYGSFS
ncbi:hypothetical protein SAMN04487897_101221 [Paenibacillus sp. yr247]|uniref:hypothetical protein n=1 Tax=Paenibacillus sp. yr247 TaxID=1761880 RepID=UPI000886426E|nr:hypothetical protein [Paenibacillus sp. yr247]SDM84113.1 hypothetical protein SAMN04487897_101221 [Paenibacillus sp. yr247]